MNLRRRPSMPSAPDDAGAQGVSALSTPRVRRASRTGLTGTVAGPTAKGTTGCATDASCGFSASGGFGLEGASSKRSFRSSADATSLRSEPSAQAGRRAAAGLPEAFSAGSDGLSSPDGSRLRAAFSSNAARARSDAEGSERVGGSAAAGAGVGKAAGSSPFGFAADSAPSDEGVSTGCSLTAGWGSDRRCSAAGRWRAALPTPKLAKRPRSARGSSRGAAGSSLCGAAGASTPSASDRLNGRASFPPSDESCCGLAERDSGASSPEAAPNAANRSNEGAQSAGRGSPPSARAASSTPNSDASVAAAVARGADEGGSSAAAGGSSASENNRRRTSSESSSSCAAASGRSAPESLSSSSRVKTGVRSGSTIKLPYVSSLLVS